MTRRGLHTAMALLLGTSTVLTSPGVGVRASWAANEAPPQRVTQQDARPALTNRLFHVTWSAGPVGQGQVRIVGYVYNDYQVDAANVELRIVAFDESGRPVATVTQPVGETVRAGARTFFDARVPAQGQSFQVAVSSFDFVTEGEWTTLTTEQLLAAAGFQKKVADTPEKLAQLEQLTPARKLVAHQRDGQLYYVYADPETCKCLYVGTAAQYQVALEKRLENDELVALQDHVNEDVIVLTPWAPWPWPVLY